MMKCLDDPSAKAAILQRLRHLEPQTKRRWGRMSSHQMICHLSDGFRIALGEKEAVFAGSFIQRTLIKWVALNIPLPPPKGYPTLPEADQEQLGTRPQEFEADRTELVRLVERFCAVGWQSESSVHPLFGRLTKKEWMRWGHMHMNHHLQQFGL